MCGVVIWIFFSSIKMPSISRWFAEEKVEKMLRWLPQKNKRKVKKNYQWRTSLGWVLLFVECPIEGEHKHLCKRSYQQVSSEHNLFSLPGYLYRIRDNKMRNNFEAVMPLLKCISSYYSFNNMKRSNLSFISIDWKLHYYFC